MSVTALRPWTEMVKLHPDVEDGALTQEVFAVDLGAIAANDPGVAPVNRDPEAFFAATHLTADLRRLLEEVLGALAGTPGYNRVLKVRTPFGGGKSHAMAALLHAARKRSALKCVPGGEAFPDPGDVRVAVFDGEKFGALEAHPVGGGRNVQTMWGWLAWQIGGERALDMVEANDRNRTAPGGDLIHGLLTSGADESPVLLLLDEVLKHIERAATVGVLDSTLARQTKDFFQSLTVEVAKSPRAAMVYSLQWSAREALGNVALLEEIDKLASRVDQLREPVAGDEVLAVLQRRLLGGMPDEATAAAVATAYAETVTSMRRAYAETTAEKQTVEAEAIALRNRFGAAYPFHPALIDAMRERWCSVDAYQRTRGALRFLASCLHGLKRRGGARPVLGPGDLPLGDADVRLAMLKELGAQNDFDPVVLADIEGPNARAKKIDARLAQQTPALSGVRPATRLATAILVYSFGGLKREGSEGSEGLPPGVTEAELLAACVGPDLDSLTASAVLNDLRKECLYLHYDKVRYCFRKDPNITKLVEDAEHEVTRSPDEIRAKVREMLGGRLAGSRTAIVWPEKPADIPDKEPAFMIGYLPLEFAAEAPSDQERRAIAMFEKHGDRHRSYRNGIGLAIPDKKQVESVRRAVRYTMACERVEARKKQLRLTKELGEELAERKRSEEAAVESGFRGLYTSIWLPRVEDSEIVIEKVEAGGRPLQATRVDERVMELLTTVGTPRVHGTLNPRKIVERMRLSEAPDDGGQVRLGVSVSDVVDAFYGSIEPPRVTNVRVIMLAVARGVEEGVFGYCSGPLPPLGPDGRYQVPRERVFFGRAIGSDEVDLDTGFVMLPSAIPEQTPASDSGGGESVAITVATGTGAIKEGPAGATTPDGSLVHHTPGSYSVRFAATRDQVFKAFPAVANLADKADAGKITITVEATSPTGFDATWLRNAVEEPLDEADIVRE